MTRRCNDELHILEPLGCGGIHQHAVAVAELVRPWFNRIVIHTAVDAELRPEGIDICGCVDWKRTTRFGRNLRFVARYVLRTLPHVAWRTRRQVVHIQGAFREPLTAFAFVAARGARRTVFSPHNTFSRTRSTTQRLLLPLEARLADCCIAYSDIDVLRLKSWRGKAIRLPLLLVLPPVDESAVLLWRERLTSGNRSAMVVLFAGQIRRDKRLDLAIGAVELLEGRAVLGVVGEDRGDLERCRALADSSSASVLWFPGYWPLSDFAAAIAAADVVICPYERGSQSAVVALAHMLGVPSVTTAVGGIGEAATVAVADATAAALADGLVRAACERTQGDVDSNSDAAADYVSALTGVYTPT